MAYLDREQFAQRARQAVPLRAVTVEGVGDVAVQAMTGLDLEEHGADMGVDELADHEVCRILCKWISRLVVTEDDRRPLFTGADDEALLSLDTARLMEFGVAVINAATGMVEEPEAGKVEEMTTASSGG